MILTCPPVQSWEQVVWTDALKENNLLALLNTFKLFQLAQHFHLSVYISKPSSNIPDSLGQTSCTLKVQQLNEQISERFQMGRHLHAWALKAKHIEGKYNPPISPCRYGSAIFQTSVRFSYFRTCARASLQGGGWGSSLCWPITVFNSQLKSGSEANRRQTYPIQRLTLEEKI